MYFDVAFYGNAFFSGIYFDVVIFGKAFFLHECTLKWPYTEKLFFPSGIYCTLMWSFQEKLFFFKDVNV